MEHTYTEFFEAVAGLMEQVTVLVDDNLPYYLAFTDNVVHGRTTDIASIERELDSMLAFCFDDRILLLYKKILRKIFNQHPETVKCYVDVYHMMYGENGGEGE